MRAVAESRRPGLSPTRGSGFGADVDMFGAGDALGLEDIVDDDEAHAFTYSAPTASEANRNGAAGRRVPARGKGDSRFTVGCPLGVAELKTGVIDPAHWP